MLAGKCCKALVGVVGCGWRDGVSLARLEHVLRRFVASVLAFTPALLYENGVYLTAIVCVCVCLCVLVCVCWRGVCPFL